MFFSRTCPSIFRAAALFAATTAFAGPPMAMGGFHGGGAFGGAIPRGGLGSAGRVWSGGTVAALPRGYATYPYGGAPYYLSGGLWYRPWNGLYVGCYPPIGLCLPLLPLGFMSFWDDGVRYYTCEDVYYTDAPTGGYQVAEPPPGREPVAQPAPGSADAAALDALVIVPGKGQDAERVKRDRNDAQRFALAKSGYDPATGDPNDPGTPRARRAYLKAMKAYLEERGYQVN